MRKTGFVGGTICVATLFASMASAESFAPTRFTVVSEGLATGPAVLLLPGLASSQEVFDAEAKRLAPAYHLYRVQVNGFAGQPAGANATGPVLKPVVEELHQYLTANHVQAAVIGHSLGGLLGLMLADAHPEDVRKLLIVDTLPFYALVFNPAATAETMQPQAVALRDGMLQAPEAAFQAQSAQTAAFLVNDAEGRKLVIASSAASDRKVFAMAMYEDLVLDMRPRLAGIKTPAVLLYPYDPSMRGADPASVEGLYKGAYAGMPNLTLHRIEGSRHFIMYDQPGLFAAEVGAFLK